mmetsp:Transcript_19407/g.62305  ORF Transcript_19407/g.62305 Transcript_19407/m.62305 type:complete len:137 (+) Transcript_19407:2987-3397(+)
MMSARRSGAACANVWWARSAVHEKPGSKAGALALAVVAAVRVRALATNEAMTRRTLGPGDGGPVVAERRPAPIPAATRVVAAAAIRRVVVGATRPRTVCAVVVQHPRAALAAVVVRRIGRVCGGGGEVVDGVVTRG